MMDKDLIQTPKSSVEPHNRSKTDGALGSNNIPLSDARSRLYELFSLIDKEFEALYLENYQLKLRLGQNADATLNELLKSHEQISIGSNDLFQKLSGKKPNWKAALRAPNRLVTNLKNSRVRTFVGHTDAVLFLTSCSYNNRSLIGSASADQTARIYCAKSGNCLLQLSHESGAVNSISIRPDSHGQFNVLTASGNRIIYLWRTASFSDPNQAVISSEDDLDEVDAVSEKLNEAEEENFAHVPLVIRQPVRSYVGHTKPVVGAEWLAGGEQIISVSWDRTANIYDLESGKVVTSLTGHEDKLTFCCSHKTNRLVATASKDCTFRLWDFRDQSVQSMAIFQGHNAPVNSVVFNSTNQLISSSDDRTVKIWDLRNMRSPTASTRFSSSVNKVSASKHIAVPLDNRNIYILNLNGDRICRMHRSNGHTAMIEATTWVDDVEINNLITCSIDKQIIGWKVQLPNKS